MRSLINLIAVVFLVMLPTCLLFAQQPAIAPAPTPQATDSTRQARTALDSIPASAQPGNQSGAPIRVGSSELTLDDSSSVRTDTVRLTSRQQDRIHKIIPKKATLHSLVLPGWGQAYNRQYYKIPFIYAGFGVMGYLFVKYRGLANEAANGYRLLLYGLPSQSVTAPLPTTEAIFKPVTIPGEKVTEVQIGEFIYRSTAGAKNAYDTYRRYRDLNILLSAALWGINIVEANVAAHLKTFDLTDDISMRVEPNVLPMPGTGFVPGIRVAFTFK
ncbi:DUF5683 domain-containing protein [Spirosoma fluminis]